MCYKLIKLWKSIKNKLASELVGVVCVPEGWTKWNWQWTVLTYNNVNFIWIGLIFQISSLNKFLLNMWKWKSFSNVWLFATPWTTVHGILQARILEWVACPFSRGSSQPKDQTQVSCIAGGFFTSWATREALWTYNRPRYCARPWSIQRQMRHGS